MRVVNEYNFTSVSLTSKKFKNSCNLQLVELIKD